MFKAKLYYQSGQAYAKTDIEKSIFFNNFGALANHQENRKVAFTLFQHAVKLNPANLTARFNLANLYLRYGLIDKAISSFEYLIKFAPEDKELINGLAHAHYLNGDLKRANFYFETLPKQFVPRRGINSTRALVTHLLGDSQKALTILKESKDENSSKINKEYSQVKNFIESEIERVKDEKEVAEKAAAEKKKTDAQPVEQPVPDVKENNK